jgi:small subunit ribosomal protein S6
MGYQTKRKQMNCYETLFVVKPTLTDEETSAQVEKVKAVLTKEGAELLATDDMGMRKLAYPVEKNNRGYYTVLFYKANGSTIAELERNLKINEEVIKFLTIRYTKTKEMTQFDKLVSAASKKGELAKASKEEVVVEETTAEVAEIQKEETPATETTEA